MDDAKAKDEPLENADLYLRSLWPDRFRCLGWNLRPLTVGHVMVLRRVRSAIAIGRPPSAPDLALAVFICSRPWPAALRAVQSWTLRWRLLFLSFRVAAHPIAAREQFEAYLRSSLEPPKWWPTPSVKADEKSIGSPFWAVIELMLEREFGLSVKDSLDTPTGVALWRMAMLQEQEGRLQIVSDDERNALTPTPPTGA